MNVDFRSEHAGKRLFTVFDSTKYKKVNLYRKHRHTEMELGYILSGEGTYGLHGQEYTAVTGDLYLVCPNEQHCIHTIYSEELHSFNIHIEPYYLWAFCSEYLPGEAIEQLISGDIATRRLTNLGQYVTALMALCQQPQSHRFEIKRLMLTFLTEVTAAACQGQTLRDSVAIHNLPVIQNAIQYINEHLGEAITLQDICQAANLSPSRFSFLFKQTTGLSPYAFLLVQRVEQSLCLLRETDRSIAEIAGECGFTNLSNFNRQFKEMTGMSPRAYRRIKTMELD